MDKISLAQWNEFFGSGKHECLFSGSRYTEQQFHFEEKNLVKGSIWSFQSPGMLLTEFHLESERPIQLNDSSPEEGIESAFVRKGEIESRLSNYSQPVQFSQLSHNFQYRAFFDGIHTMKGPIVATTIRYEPDFLFSILTDICSDFCNRLEKTVSQKTDFLFSTNALSCTNAVSELLHGFRQTPLSGNARYLMMESRLLELVSLQLNLLCHPSPGTGKWNRQDLDRLYAVNEYINSHYLDSFSLRDLTRKFGLNEFKLKKGYREIFQQTVFGHVQKQKMKHAQQLLRDHEYSVTDTAFAVGYENISSFTTEYKKFFGYNPGKERK